MKDKSIQEASNQIIDYLETVEIVIAPSRKVANKEKCNRICAMYLELAKLPQFINSKAHRLQFACQIRKTRQFYLS